MDMNSYMHLLKGEESTDTHDNNQFQVSVVVSSCEVDNDLIQN